MLIVYFFPIEHFITLIIQNIILKAVQHSTTLIYQFYHFSTMGNLRIVSNFLLLKKKQTTMQ